MLAAGAACGGGGGGGGGANPVVAIAKAGAPNGDGLTATVNTALAAPLRVLVTEDGTPKSAATVQWTTANGATNPTSFTTGADGIATTTWTLGTTAGAQTARATLAGAAGSPVTFNATGTPGPMSLLVIQSGNNQQPMIDAGLIPFVVKATDQYNNPRGSETVNWSVVSGPVTLAGASSTSGVNGLATMTATAGATTGAAQILALVLDVDTVAFDLIVTPVPLAASVSTGGAISFRSDRNPSADPAVDTIAVGGTVTWSGLGNGAHKVQSKGSPSFTTQVAATATYQFTFTTAGTYEYDCTIHGNSMNGRVVVR
jgi:plastocyanin